jgi:outer membrane protein assembly factor BamB
MDLSRRRFLAFAGQSLALGGTGLLLACQSPQQTVTVTSVPAANPTQAPTTKPAAAPAASPAASVAPVAAAPSPLAAASPSAAAAVKPSASPAVAAAASPSPARPPGAAVAGKPMYQMDPQHTGRSPHTGPRRLSLLRTFNTTLPENRPADAPPITTPDIQSSTVVGPDGTIYATTFGGWLYALRDSSTAKDRLDLAWRFRPPDGGSPAHGTAAISPDGSTVYVGYATGTAPAVKGTLFALKAPSSGLDAQIAWQADLGSGSVANSPTLMPDGTLYYINALGLLSAIDTSAGRLKWTAQTGAPGAAQFGQTVKVAPAVAPDGNTVYTTALTGSLYAVTPPSSGDQGLVKWSFDFGEHLGPTSVPSTPVTNGGNRGQDGIGSAASATIGPDGTIYVGANNSNFYAIDPTGQQKWLYEAQRELAGIWTTAALSPDASTLYFGANKGGVYALATRDGTLKWEFEVYGSIYGSPALDARGTLYVPISDDHVFALDSATGDLVADYFAGTAVWSAPSIRPDGTVVVADRMGRVQVLGEA